MMIEGLMHDSAHCARTCARAQKLDSFFWRSITSEFLAVAAFLFSVITTIAYSTDVWPNGRIDSDKHLLLALVFGLAIFLLVYFTAGLR
jgi:formate/nitrite transporter FocA (FNT family)